MIELLLLAYPAAAQSTAPAKGQNTAASNPAAPTKQDEKAAPDSDATVTVVGSRESNRIDRQVYDVSTDVAASASTAADALNKVPSVSVSPDGTVTLRGKDVQIMVDGKPSAMMQGESRGAVLNALPAEDIQSIEVVNNPGAQFGNEGGGGPILNLVTRRQRPGAFGGVNANVGPGGRHNAALYGNLMRGSFGLQGSAFVRADRMDITSGFSRERIDPATGQILTRDTRSSTSMSTNETAGFNSTLTYNLSDKNTLGAGLSYSRSTSHSDGQADYRSVGINDSVLSDYVRSSTSRNAFENFSGNVRFDHKGERQGEIFKLDLRLSGNNRPSQIDYANHYMVRPAHAAEPQSRQNGRPEARIADFTGDYDRPTERGMLKLGYKLADHRNVLDVRYADIDPATLAETVNKSRTNRFALDERTAALWSSYELRLNQDWGVMGGLRAEYTDLNMDQMTSNIQARNNDVTYIPSFFLRYYATENTTIRFSYAHRIRRPNAGELNPFVVYIDELNVSSGNPELKPSETDSFELGYETKIGALNTNLRGYYRRDTDVILPRQVFIGENVLLTTRANAGSNRSGGLEFSLSGKLLPNLSVNTSGNLAYIEQNTMIGSLGGDSRRTTSSLSGRTMFNYELPNRDKLQLMLNAQGKTPTGQGVRKGWQTADLDFRHNLTPSLSLVMKVQDVFNSRKNESITDTALLQERSMSRFGGHVFYFGLAYRLGGFAPTPAQRPATPPAGPGAPVGG